MSTHALVVVSCIQQSGNYIFGEPRERLLAWTWLVGGWEQEEYDRPTSQRGHETGQWQFRINLTFTSLLIRARVTFASPDSLIKLLLLLLCGHFYLKTLIYGSPAMTPSIDRIWMVVGYLLGYYSNAYQLLAICWGALNYRLCGGWGINFQKRLSNEFFVGIFWQTYVKFRGFCCCSIKIYYLSRDIRTPNLLGASCSHLSPPTVSIRLRWFLFMTIPDNKW